MATYGGGWHRIGTVGILLLAVTASGSGGAVAPREHQPSSATKHLSSCQPLCWSTDEHVGGRSLLWAARSGINQFWECQADGDQWFAQLRTCPVEGMRYNFEAQSCRFEATLSGESSPSEPVCARKNSHIPGWQPLAEGNELCPEPSCVSQPHIETLWGYVDPAFFLQCRPVADGTWRLQLMPCAPGTWFHFREQVCVFPLLWEGCDGTEDAPGGSTPGVTTPEITTPAVTTPEITTPAVTTPVVTTPEVTTPAVTTPAVTTPAVTTPAITTPAVTTPELTTPAVTTPELTTPAVTTPEVTTPAPTTPALTTPAVTTPDSITNDPDSPIDPCFGPRCATWEEINTLWVHPNPNFFFQCRPLMGGWSPQQMPCAPGTLFSFFHQVCVHSFDWVDPCDGSDVTSDQTPSIPTNPTPVTPTPITPTANTPSVPTPAPTPTPSSTPSTSPNPGLVDCLTPNCMLLQDEVIRLPSRTGPQFFYRCVFLLQSLWLPFEDACPDGQYFSFPEQSCIDPSGWVDLCPSDETLTTTQMTTLEPEPTATPPEFPLPVICGSPRCTTPEERSFLWPSTVADMYYRCVWVERLFQFVPFPERCENFLLFDFLQQTCVFPLDWVDICPMYPTLPRPPCTDCCPTCPPPTPDTPADPELPIPIICGMPRCITAQERAFKWPAQQPQEYYECLDNGDGWVQATLQTCPTGLLFQTLAQTCVPAEEYDADFCPVYPPLSTPPPTEQPEPDVCIADYDPSPVLPIICDLARCGSAEERATLWPTNDPTRYIQCQPVEDSDADEYTPVVGECPPGQSFYFFTQCCRSEPPGPLEVCPLYPSITTPGPVPPAPICIAEGDFNPDPIIPLECDQPRCGTDMERNTLWPSTDEQVYYRCFQQISGLYEPVLQNCPTATTFDFLLQCCSPNAPIEPNVCTVFVERLPASDTVPLPIVCDQPRCGTERERAFYWPASDRRMLYMCEWQPNEVSFAPRMYACGEEQVFHVWKQDCVDRNSTLLNVCPSFDGRWIDAVRATTLQTEGPAIVGPILTPPNIG